MALRHSILMSMFLLGLLSSEVGVVWALTSDSPESAPAPEDPAPIASPPAPPAPTAPSKRPPPPPADDNLPPVEAPSPDAPSEAPAPPRKHSPPPKKAPAPKRSPPAPPPAPVGSQGVNVVDRGAASTLSSQASSGVILATALLALLLR